MQFALGERVDLGADVEVLFLRATQRFLLCRWIPLRAYRVRSPPRADDER